MKLVVAEEHSAEVRDFVTSRDVSLATSAVAVVEVPRAAACAGATHEERAAARAFVAACTLVEITPRVLDLAAALEPWELRTLDAIHLASAARIGSREMLVYDRRLAAAARRAGVDVLAPGT